MSALSMAAEGAAAAERELLVSACTVTRPGVQTGELDPATGLRPHAPAVVIGSLLRCYVKGAATAAQSNVGGDIVAVAKPQVWLSVSAPRLRIGDRITITASPAPVNIGRVFTVTGTDPADLSVLARYDVEVTVP